MKLLSLLLFPSFLLSLPYLDFSLPLEYEFQSYTPEKDVQSRFQRNDLKNPTSFNYAVEKQLADPRLYIQESKKKTKQSFRETYFEYGDVSCHCGKGPLFHFDVSLPEGSLRVAQWLLAHDSTVYILTLCTHKENFSKRLDEFLSTIKSARLVESPPQTALINEVEFHSINQAERYLEKTEKSLGRQSVVMLSYELTKK